MSTQRQETVTVTCDSCGARNHGTGQGQVRMEELWPRTTWRGTRLDLCPVCAARVEAAFPGLVKATREAQLGACDDCG